MKSKCHLQSLEEGDKFCSVCGVPAFLTTVETDVKEAYAPYLPPYVEHGLSDWFEYSDWPEGSTKLDIVQYSYDEDPIVGFRLSKIGDIMHGEIGPNTFDPNAENLADTRKILLKLGFSEDDITFYHVGDIH